MKKVEIFDEDNCIFTEDDFSRDTYTIYPERKRFKYESSIKDDCFYNYLTYEYKISANPIELHVRLLEKKFKPPETWMVKDGVVLEAELSKKELSLGDEEEQITELKKDTDWHNVELLNDCELNFLIISKHPEIIPNEDYRRLLRQSEQRIMTGLIKVDKAIQLSAGELEIHVGKDGTKSIWFPDTEENKKEWEEHLNEWEKSLGLGDKKHKKDAFEEKSEYVEKFTNSLFLSTSSKFIGITENEFRESTAILEHIEKLLDGNTTLMSQKVETEAEKAPLKNIVYSIIVYSLTALLVILKLTGGISWSWFGILSPILVWEGLGFLRGFLISFAKKNN